MTRYSAVDTNPFQKRVVQEPSATYTKAKTPKSIPWQWLMVLAVPILAIAYFLSPYSPVKLPADPRMFIGGAGLSHKQARLAYAESYETLQNGDPKVALAGFKSLEQYYPGLRDLILLHQAEAKAKLGDEAGVQILLKRLLTDYPESPLGPKAQYELGQSYYRASMPDEALKVFNDLKTRLPEQQYGIASRYYLGLLSDDKTPSGRQARLLLWKDYLAQCPDCTFSADIASRLEKLLPTQTSLDHQQLGLAYASTDQDWDKALFHLKAAPFKTAWFGLGTAYLKTDQVPLAQAAWLNGLKQKADNTQRVVETIDQLVRLPNIPAKSSLMAAMAYQLPNGGDYVLWRLSQLDPEQAPHYWQQIVSQYPMGDYAPESSWRLLWPLVTTDATTYVSKARQHIDRYPYAKSTPAVLFWMGKLAEKTDKAAAQKLYQQLSANYPDNYYAFRAQSRYLALTGKSDAGWQTSSKTAYPPKSFDFKKLAILPIAADFVKASPKTGQRAYQMSEELVKIGAADDLALVVDESLGKLPPAVDSWVNHQWGNRPKALRAMRDGLQEEAKILKRPVIPTDDELSLLYPIYFEGPISSEAPRHGIDPFLAQALMREESYFNEKAVSSSNALGLMQLLPATAGDVAQWEKLSNFQPQQLFLPPINIRLGTRYLEYLHETFNGNSMPSVGAYNGGPNAMKRWIAASTVFNSDPDLFIEQIPYDQTRDYIKKVFGSYWNYRRLYGG